jgi:hypothetical protein
MSLRVLWLGFGYTIICFSKWLKIVLFSTILKRIRYTSGILAFNNTYKLIPAFQAVLFEEFLEQMQNKY